MRLTNLRRLAAGAGIALCAMPSLAAVLTADQLLDWAEAVYGPLFPGHQQSFQYSAGGQTYTLRHYPQTQHYLGITADGGVHGLGAFTGNQIQSFGKVDDFVCLVVPARCPVALGQAVNHTVLFDPPSGKALTITFADRELSTVSVGDFVAFDANAASPVPVLLEGRDDWAQYGGSFNQWSIDAGNGLLRPSPGRGAVFTYVKNGRFMVLEARRDSVPLPRAASTLETRQVCMPLAATPTFNDLADAMRSGMVLRRPGPDGQCNTPDDTFAVLRFAMAANEAALETQPYLASIRGRTGAITGHLVRDGSAIRRVDAEFKSPVTLFNATSTSVRALAEARDARNGTGVSSPIQLLFDGSTVLAYNTASGAGPVMVGTTSAPERTTAVSFNNETVLVLAGAGEQKLVRIEPSLAFTTLATEAGAISSVAVTPTHVAYVVLPGGSADQQARTVAKSGASAPVALTACAAAGRSPSRIALVAMPERLYCGPLAFTTSVSLGPNTAGVGLFHADGRLIRTLTQAAIVGYGTYNPAPLGGDGAHTVLLAEELSATSAGFGGARLRLHDGVDDRVLADFGALPPLAGINGLLGSPMPWPSTDTAVAIVSALSSASGQADYFLLRQTAPSVMRLTSRIR